MQNLTGFLRTHKVCATKHVKENYDFMPNLTKLDHFKKMVTPTWPLVLAELPPPPADVTVCTCGRHIQTPR